MQQVSQKNDYHSAGLIVTGVTDLSWYGRSVYIKIRQRVGKFLSIIPLAALFLVLKPLLMYFVYNLKDKNKNSMLIITDGADYKFYKELYNKLSIHLDTMQKLQSINLEKQNIFNRSLLRDVSRIADSGIEFHRKIDSKLKSLNLANDGENFKSISESQLWNIRTRAYDYVL